MSYSENETAALIRRAALGAGLEAGVADDVAEASLWLIRRGAPGAEAAADALTRPQPPSADVRAACALSAVIDAALVGADLAGADLAGAAAASGGARATLSLKGVDVPLLAAGLVGARAEQLGLAAEFFASDGAALPLGPALSRAEAVTVSAGPPPDEARAAVRCALTPAARAALDALARKTLTTSSAASRSRGAGAGAEAGSGGETD